ncbi:hypothetical protein Tco_0502971 [Tanacetum coccineum]
MKFLYWYPFLEEQISPISNDVAEELVQEDSTDLDGNTLITLYHSPMFKEVESSPTAEDPSNVHEFTQVQPSTHTWTKAYPSEQVIGDPSKLVLTRSRLNTDVKVCMYALTRLDVWELVPKLAGRNIIGVKWLRKNKIDAEHIMIRKKSCLVAKENGHMEEYIELEAEKARRRGQEWNWETATYGKVRYFDDIDYFKYFENEFPAIVYNDALVTDHKISSEPSDLRNDNDKVNIELPSDDASIKPSDSIINDNVDTNSHEFDESIETNHDMQCKGGFQPERLAQVRIFCPFRKDTSFLHDSFPQNCYASPFLCHDFILCLP